MARPKFKQINSPDRLVNHLQSQLSNVLDPLVKEALLGVSFTTDKTGAVLQGYLMVDTPSGQFWLPVYSKPTGP